MAVDTSQLPSAPPGDSSQDFIMVFRPGAPLFTYKIPLSSLGSVTVVQGSGSIELTFGGEEVDLGGQELDV